MNITANDAISMFHEAKLPSGTGELDQETLELLRKVQGYADPAKLSAHLTAGIRTLWVARVSGELSGDDDSGMLCLLEEYASLLEHAIAATQEAAWRLSEYDGRKQRGGDS